jgi:hypothetical protein
MSSFFWATNGSRGVKRNRCSFTSGKDYTYPLRAVPSFFSASFLLRFIIVKPLPLFLWFEDSCIINEWLKATEWMMVRRKGKLVYSLSLMVPHTVWVSAQNLTIFHLESTWCEPRLNHNLSPPITIYNPLYTLLEFCPKQKLTMQSSAYSCYDYS